MSLTVRQHRLLTLLAERIGATGVCPSIKEMMHALGTRGRGSVSDTIDILEQRGYLRRLFHRRARCIEILRLPDDLSQRWLEAVSNAAMVRELMRRGIGAATGADLALCGDCGAQRCALPGADLALLVPPPAGDDASGGAADAASGAALRDASRQAAGDAACATAGPACDTASAQTVADAAAQATVTATESRP